MSKTILDRHFDEYLKYENYEEYRQTKIRKYLAESRKGANTKIFMDPVALDPDRISFYDRRRKDTCYFKLISSLRDEVTPENTEKFLKYLVTAREPISFEILGKNKKITYQITASKGDVLLIQDALESSCQYLWAEKLDDDPLYSHYLTKTKAQGLIFLFYDAWLPPPYFLPITSFSDFNTDPLEPVYRLLSSLKDRELGFYQVLVLPSASNWPVQIRKALAMRIADSEFTREFHPYYSEETEFKAAEQMAHLKADSSRSFFAVSVRFGVFIEKRHLSLDRFDPNHLLNLFCHGTKKFRLLERRDYFKAGLPKEDHLYLFFNRVSFRQGMILNSAELAGLMHFPSKTILEKDYEVDKVGKTRSTPDIALGNKLVLGENVHRGKRKLVSLEPKQRTRHMYVIGTTGAGKTYFLLNMVAQDIANGEGVGVFDPHGQLVPMILPLIPKERYEDIILFDPSKYPIAFNILHPTSEKEKNLLAEDIVSIFRRLSSSWGAQMNSVLANAVLSFVKSKREGNLRDLRMFLLDGDFRKECLKSVDDEEIRLYWQEIFPKLIGNPVAPILTRLDVFLRPKIIRQIVGQNKNTLNFREMMDERKVFLCNLSGIGSDNAYLLGALLVSRFQQTVMTRTAEEETQKHNFYLYIDEFQNMVCKSMEQILSGARKYGLGMILAHQELRQTWEKDREVAGSVTSNPLTRVCFRLGDFDAQKLQRGFSHFESEDLQNLSERETIVRIERAEYDFNMRTLEAPKIPSKEEARQNEQRIIALSYKKYATKPEDIETQPQKEEAQDVQPESENFWEE